MKSASFNLEFITPCFCAGAEQSRAEIRPSSVRGQLRWWFRVLGGSLEDESAVFGGVAGSGSASSISVRFTLDGPARPWQLPRFSPNDIESYVYYFASVSGTTQTGAKGPRWADGAMLGPGTQAILQIIQPRPLSLALQSHFDFALEAFLACGVLGLRGTRGLGAFHCAEKPISDDLLARLRSAGFSCEIRPERTADDRGMARLIGGLVKGTRKHHGWSAGKVASPLGDSSPRRQNSAILFRPIREKIGSDLKLLVLEAPHSRVLDSSSRRPTATVGHDSPLGLMTFRPEPRGR